MFAAQLLRILQTVTTDVNHQTCVYDSAPGDMTMKENQIITTHIKETGLPRDNHPSLFETKKFQNRPLHCPENLDDPISSNTNSKDETHNPPTADGELAHRSENEILDLFSDKNVLEYKHPELIVCCKEINYHVVKDICVDEGEAAIASRKILLANGAIDEENAELIIANQQRTKSESNVTKPVRQNAPKLISASDEESFMDRGLPVEEYGTRSFLRSFMSTLDREGDSEAGVLCYKSEVETKSITFNFTSGADMPNMNPDVRFDQGESSFSAEEHSGPIAFSGSISLRSDGSATSGKSFAFPM